MNKNESRGENLSEPVLVAHFEEIRQKPDLNPDMEEFSNIFENDEYRKHCFEEAKKAFLFVYDKEKFNGYLNENPSEEGRKYLKNVRQYGTILKSMYYLFNASHQYPKDLAKFLSNLGEYNDKYWLKKIKKVEPQDFVDPNSMELSIDFTDGSDFKKQANGMILQINESTENSILPIKKFHELRKNIRSLANLIQVAAAENLGGNLHWLFASILELSVMLGKEHDEFVRKGLAGEIDYNSSEAEVDKSIADKFKNLEPFIKKVIGLS